jgi:hypothetical protein
VLRWANEHDSKFAFSLIGKWIESDSLILKRLAISGMAGYRSFSSKEKLAWAISNHLVENVGLKNEAFALLAAVYARSGEPVRMELLRQAETAMNPAGEDYERYEFFNLLSWLHAHAPDLYSRYGEAGSDSGAASGMEDARTPGLQLLDRRRCRKSCTGKPDSGFAD